LEKVLVTGASGFVGGALARRLATEGFNVRVLVRPTSNIENLRKVAVDIVAGDIRDRKSLKKALKGIEKVFHVAALFRRAKFPDKVFWDINVAGTKNMIEESFKAGAKKFIHCSTVGVLSNISNPPADESFPYNPSDIYQRTKAEGEKFALEFHRKEGLAITVIRPAMIYGPGDLRLLKLFKAIARRRFVMIGDGKTLAHFIYIDDLIDAFLLASLKEKAIGQVYIISGEGPFSLNELTRMIARKLKVPPSGLHLPAKPFQIIGSICENICKPMNIEPPIYRRRIDFFTKNRAFTSHKAEIELGFQPKVTMSEGIGETISWYKKNGYL